MFSVGFADHNFAFWSVTLSTLTLVSSTSFVRGLIPLQQVNCKTLRVQGETIGHAYARRDHCELSIIPLTNSNYRCWSLAFSAGRSGARHSRPPRFPPQYVRETKSPYDTWQRDPVHEDARG